MPDVEVDLSQADLAALVELAPELAEDTSLTSLLDRLLDRAVALTESSAGTAYLYDDKHRKLYVAHAVGPAAPVVLEKYGAGGEGIPIVGSKAGGVFGSGEPIIVNEISDDPEHYKVVDRTTARPTSSMIAVPLVVSGERIGVIQLLNRQTGPYTEYEVALLTRFASLAAVAVRNARLFGEMAARIGVYGLPRDSVDAPTLRRLLNAPPQSERVSILFVDMRGYSRLEQVLRIPELMQSRLNEFLTMLTDAVLEEHGVINKFLGDGLMALFRGTEQEIRAVRCAHDMVRRFMPLRQKWDREANESLEFIDIGIGIATDTVILCTVGSEDVREFTAMGRAVILASTLVHKARDGRRVLTDRLTYRNAEAIIDESREVSRLQIKSVGAGGPDYNVYEIVSLNEGQGGSAPSEPAAPPAVAPPSRQVFVSYSHADSSSLDELHTHLSPFLKREDFEIWDDTRIAAGDQWRDQIQTSLARAGATVLLVSPTFLSSEFIDRHELPPLFEAARKRGLRIFWIPVSASAYDETEIANYQALHDPRKPLDLLEPAERNAAWVKICRQIANALRKPDGD